MIEDFIKFVPDWMLDRSGNVFSSGRTSFEKPSDLYVLTGHPGGNPADEKQTLRSHIDMVLHGVPEEWSNFRDISWGRFQKGQHVTQKSMLHLFDGLGRSPSDVPASTLVFLRAQSNEELKDKNKLADNC